MVSTYNLDEIIEGCNNGKYINIAKAGNAPCFDIDENYVLVIHQKPKYAERFKQLSDSLGDNKGCICTVVDYKVEDEQKVYELQRKAKGEHFRIDSTKQALYDNISNLKKYTEKLIKDNENGISNMSIEQIESYYNSQLKSFQRTMNSPLFKERVDKRSDDLLRRYSLIMDMPKEHLVDFFKSVLILHDNKIEYDSSGNNVLYDKENGFSIIDLEDYSKRPDLKGDMETLISSNNYQTMNILLGINKFNELHEEEIPLVQEMMREALKKICVSVIDLEYNGQKMSKEIMEKSLETYKKYNIDLSYDEIEKESKKQHIMI